MKVVVTGANGFLGSNLIRRLEKENAEVYALVRPTSDLSELKGLKCKLVYGDVTDAASLLTAFEGADTIFHLAGAIAYKASQRGLMEKVNVEGTRNVIRACQADKVRRLVHLSSVVAVGAGHTPQEILNEESPYNVADLHLGYFDTKRDAEKLIFEAVRAGTLDAVMLNPSTAYGPGDARKDSRKTQLKVARGEFPFYTSGGVSIVGVDDVLDGIIAGWKKGRSGERYILSGENITIHQLFDMIAELAGVPKPKYKLPDALIFTLGFIGDLKEKMGLKSSVSVENAHTSTMFHWFDNSKARRELGFNPRPARAALSESIAWIREHGLLDKSK